MRIDRLPPMAEDGEGGGKVCSVCSKSMPAAYYSKKQYAAKAHCRKCLQCSGQANATPREQIDKAAQALGITKAELEAMQRYAGVEKLNPQPIDLDPREIREGTLQRGDALRAIGFNAKHIKRLDTFSRLSRLTGLVGAASAAGEQSVADELEELVLHGSEVQDITSAREKCAGLLSCAVAMRDEATYLMENPEEAMQLRDWNKDEALRVRDELLALVCACLLCVLYSCGFVLTQSEFDVSKTRSRLCSSMYTYSHP